MNQKTVKIVIAVCALFMAALFVVQFIPFFEYEGETVSLAEYLWLTYDYKSMTRYLEKEFNEDCSIGGMIWVPLIMFVLSVFGIVMYLIKRDSVTAPVVGVVCGLATVYGFLSKPVYQSGRNWIVFVLLGAAMVITGIASIVLKIIVKKKTIAAD